MKIVLRSLLAAALTLPIIGLQIAPALAVTDGLDTTASKKTETKTESTDDTTKVATTDTSSSDDSSKPETDDSSRATRLQKRKSEAKTKMTDAQQKKLASVCKGAQGKAGGANNRAQSLGAERGKSYKKIVEKLQTTATKLKEKGVDVTTLEADITQLQTLIDTFNTDLKTYRQDMSDVVAMDCASDPAAFQAALTAARADREVVFKDSQAIREYVEKTIRPELKKVRETLSKTDDAPSTTDTTETKPTGGQ